MTPNGHIERALLESLYKSLRALNDEIAYLETLSRELGKLRKTRHEIEDRIRLLEQGQLDFDGYIDYRVMPTDWLEETASQHP